MGQKSIDELLERYYQAANVLAKRHPQGTVPNADADPRTEPFEELLARQARSLQSMYDAHLSVDVNESSDILEDRRRLVSQRLDDLASICVSKLYAYRHDQVPDCWRYLYTDTLVLMTYHRLLDSFDSSGISDGQAWNYVVEHLDRALITTGGQSRYLGPSWIEQTMSLLALVIEDDLSYSGDDRPNKRQKINSPTADTFSMEEPFGRPTLTSSHECPRHADWTLDRFETYMNKQDQLLRPVVFTHLISSWPAFTDRPWESISYLLSQTLGGRRLVPVEIGRSYVDADWGQELIPFKSLLEKYILSSSDMDEKQQVGYLAQHNLFRQIPSLRNDISIPDFCWADVPGHPTDPSKNHETLDVPQLNAWFGPARTITPLHTDGYHNLLCQVVGKKYVRLYPPSASDAMRPRAKEGGVDMSNTGLVDVGALEGWDEPAADEEIDEGVLKGMREGLKGIEYWECILEPGDTLLIPLGWWHYVRSLSVSFSVSFWWN